MPVDGAPVSDDPVLAGALSEMESEGAFEEPSDLDTGATSDEGADVVAAAAPVEGTPAPVVTPDPLEGTQPFTYKGTDGTERTLEGVYRVPGEGLLVPEDKVASLQALAERADAQDRTVRDTSAQNQAFQRLSEWKTTGPDGKETTLSGHEGIAALRTEHGKLTAAFETLAGYFKDPQKFASLVGVAQDAHGNSVIVPNDEAMRHLLTECDLAEERAARVQDAAIKQLMIPPQQAPDFSTAAPKLIDQAAGVNGTHLTPADRQLLGQQMARYVRDVRQGEQGWNGKIVDASYAQLVQHTAQVRADAKAAALASEKAGKHNSGMDKGRQPAPSKATPVPPKPPTDTRGKKADWDTPLADALAEMGIPAR